MNIFKRQYNFLPLCTKSHKIQKRVNNNYWYYCYYYYLYFLFSERNFLLQNSKIIYDVKIKRNLYHWSTIGDLHASIIGDPRFSLETPRFSLEIPRFSLKTPRFLLETPRLLLETPRFALETPIFSLKTPDFC